MHKIYKSIQILLCTCIITQTTLGYELTIFLATSLKPPIDELLIEFNKQNPAAKFKIQAQGSQILKFQIESGANADIFLSADFEYIEELKSKNLIDQNNYGKLVKNKLVIAVSDYYLQKIPDIITLINSPASLVLGSKNSPLGKYTNQLIATFANIYDSKIKDAIYKKVISYEQNSAHTLAKLKLGVADAAILYYSDIAQSKATVTYNIIENQYQPDINCGYAIIKNSQLTFEAKKFIVFLKSISADKTFKKYGMERL